MTTETQEKIQSSIINKLTEERDTYKKMVDDLSTKKNNTELIEWIIRLQNDNDSMAGHIRDLVDKLEISQKQVIKLNGDINSYTDANIELSNTLNRLNIEHLDFKTALSNIARFINRINILNFKSVKDDIKLQLEVNFLPNIK